MGAGPDGKAFSAVASVSPPATLKSQQSRRVLNTQDLLTNRTAWDTEAQGLNRNFSPGGLPLQGHQTPPTADSLIIVQVGLTDAQLIYEKSLILKPRRKIQITRLLFTLGLSCGNPSPNFKSNQRWTRMLTLGEQHPGGPPSFVPTHQPTHPLPCSRPLSGFPPSPCEMIYQAQSSNQILWNHKRKMEFRTEIKLGGDIKSLLFKTVQGNANEDRLHKEFWHLNEDLWRIFGIKVLNTRGNGHIKIPL